MDGTEASPASMNCPRCGSLLPRAFLDCPNCGALIHADRLTRLAAQAEDLTAEGESEGAVALWREALALIPAGTRQYEIVKARAESPAEADGPPIAAEAPDGTEPERRGSWAKQGLAGAGALALLLWKLKWVLTFVVTKAKLLLAGLTKGSTFFSMMLSLGVYWAAWGWKFGLGLVVSIYVHEMGHVAMLRHYGIKSSAPMFIPGIGAAIRLEQYPKTPREEARVGLAGPIWGLGAAIAAWLVHLLSGWPSWAAIARVGAWINLFNLIPVWQLDGSRGFASLTHEHRWIAAGAIGAAWILTREGLLILLLIAAVLRLAGGEAPDRRDTPVLLQYVALVLVLTWMSTLPVPLD